LKVTALSKRAVVRMWHAWPASASHSMIVRRLWVTPAVGSLMQWLFARRNRTTERTNRHSTRQHVNAPPRRIEDVAGSRTDGTEGTVAGTAERTAQAHSRGSVG